MLKIIDLTKVYRTGAKALSGVSFEVDLPQVVAIIGPSGAGKSTLIRCINRLIDPTSGQVLLDATNLVTLGRSDLRKARRRIGMIFQEYNLVDRLTVMENLLSGRLGYVNFWKAYRRKFPSEDIAAAFQLLDRVGLEGYQDTRADEPLVCFCTHLDTVPPWFGPTRERGVLHGRGACDAKGPALAMIAVPC